MHQCCRVLYEHNGSGKSLLLVSNRFICLQEPALTRLFSNAPGGQFVQTQFWDTSPSTGPTNSWTVHGLWPDHCDGTYDANCDTSREYTNITQILKSYGKTDLLSYMDTYWKDYQGNDESFWEHEWAKHGTCISTLKPSCYGSSYTPQQEVVDYFQQAVTLFKTLDSYTVGWMLTSNLICC